ncbi:hypothetical protein NKG94_38775 [Micromonospora sp. M12]
MTIPAAASPPVPGPTDSGSPRPRSARRIPYLPPRALLRRPTAAYLTN